MERVPRKRFILVLCASPEQMNKFPGHLTEAPTRGAYFDAKRDVAEVLRTVQAVGGILSYVAGGCARDFALGGVPKDVDVVAHSVERGSQELVVNALRMCGYSVTADYTRQYVEGHLYLVDDVSLGQAPVEDGKAIDSHSINVLTDPRWNRVTKLTKPGHMDVDILFTGEPDLAVVVDTFDYNINQYVILRSGRAPLYVGTTPGGKLVRNRVTEVTERREAHIQAIATKYNWSF